ncbi:hypothetical protein BU14_0072s0047 [Porphyra umbilicalis]|uniref:Uncharacterized protein n=1 Tax=Porphyra umbilicalis TaxID=2786 RepID=A0A1X6PFR2_PORUM|nr:hypothetical protein BU14_0072s0047 [Porphyra umbilicalis]|eukprot:OSX79689.1 hypothetical protein BU14_0072s0047 [Porphyra umbilicalis]
MRPATPTPARWDRVARPRGRCTLTAAAAAPPRPAARQLDGCRPATRRLPPATAGTGATAHPAAPPPAAHRRPAAGVGLATAAAVAVRGGRAARRGGGGCGGRRRRSRRSGGRLPCVPPPPRGSPTVQPPGAPRAAVPDTAPPPPDLVIRFRYRSNSIGCSTNGREQPGRDEPRPTGDALRHTIVSIHPPDDQEHCPCAGQRQWPADQFVALFHSWCVGFSTPIPAVPQLFSLQFVLSPGLL